MKHAKQFKAFFDSIVVLFRFVATQNNNKVTFSDCNMPQVGKERYTLLDYTGFSFFVAGLFRFGLFRWCVLDRLFVCLNSKNLVHSL